MVARVYILLMVVIEICIESSNTLCNFFPYSVQDVFIECEDSYGPIEEMNICDNLGDHLVGNIYIKVYKLYK